MLPLRKIICPTDFSAPSYVALNTACELAAHFSAELVLVHVITPAHILPITGSPEASTAYDVAAYMEAVEKDADDTLARVARERRVLGLSVRTRLVRGDPAAEIVKAVEDEKADIIVIATHGRTGWNRLLFGSVAEKVVRLSVKPVLVVQKPSEKE